MWQRQVAIVFFTFISFSNTFKYQAIPENEDIFTDCKDQPNGVYGIGHFLDFSEITYETVGQSVIWKGISRSLWDIKSKDRIQFELRILEYAWGDWQPTLYSMKVPDFCSKMYDTDQYWYKFWLSNLKNLEDVKDKCLMPGTKYENGNCNMTVVFESYLLMYGRYKGEAKFTAFDEFNKPRPIKICFETRFELHRLS
ncbi:uncharacterized protein LOC133838812 [Drosophila sulfurigaster albostrigata]|uniref:uncharacterized protein LOC133838812 n=1 Tax=Drosophila sulfurigaster albostrigata TaxID=89887 RepID=UPI002D21D833|nr:uncharacterized protein LOC133838812 [Drosophila sulfurigaster albostrigata]